MGRALWLRGSQDQSLAELERAVDLSPNFATAHYTLAFVHSQSGDPRRPSRSRSFAQPVAVRSDAVRHARHARARPGAPRRIRGAAEWASRPPPARMRTSTSWPSRRSRWGWPAGVEEANEYKAKIRERVPNYAMADFLGAFRFGAGGRRTLQARAGSGSESSS
jgi:hypothetical protein